MSTPNDELAYQEREYLADMAEPPEKAEEAIKNRGTGMSEKSLGQISYEELCHWEASLEPSSWEDLPKQNQNVWEQIGQKAYKMGRDHQIIPTEIMDLVENLKSSAVQQREKTKRALDLAKRALESMRQSPHQDQASSRLNIEYAIKQIEDCRAE